ncbi:hypothetical protein HYPSUDRAFT_821819 [Hypholoma sublateritium FD-334 SS-4]|uniref:Cytochrome c domain-containing protein n=1 Tax=Hypholoma sublateritium (strain FD-334 SS-4) TaxID=945553 RepID=A0A0D2NN42_HYPSF|nr:hypothetical protein HYPSUDRAFT_821819 [Hypholoma sublateritium FD-334 SS-4]
MVDRRIFLARCIACHSGSHWPELGAGLSATHWGRSGRRKGAQNRRSWPEHAPRDRACVT